MIEVKNLTKTYKTGNKALKGINIQIQDGEFVFIMGRSGSGKSTLLKLLLKELEPTSGQIIVNDMDLEKMPRRYIPKYRRRLGMVFQDFRLMKDKTVYENVAFAQRVIGVSSREIKKNVPEMLRLVGLSSKYKAYPNQLSGGEQQRVAIARALINSPEILLADEPTGNLDVHNSMEIMASGGDKPARDDGACGNTQPGDRSRDGKTCDHADARRADGRSKRRYLA